jgi:hypothetical protein
VISVLIDWHHRNCQVDYILETVNYPNVATNNTRTQFRHGAAVPVVQFPPQIVPYESNICQICGSHGGEYEDY